MEERDSGQRRLYREEDAAEGAIRSSRKQF